VIINNFKTLKACILSSISIPMLTSNFCLQKRQQEQEKLKKLLTVGFVSSVVLHGILAFTLPAYRFLEPDKAEKPVEVIIVEKPKPKPKPKPVVKSLPVPKVQEVKPQFTPPPPIPKPAPALQKPKLLTANTSTPSKPFTVSSAPVPASSDNLSQFSNLLGNSSPVADDSNGTSALGSPGGVATNSSAPPRPAPEKLEGISCVSNCEPEYPTSLEGVEGDAGIELVLDGDGNVLNASVAKPHSNSELNRQALLAARQMKFSQPPSDSGGKVEVRISFTVAGSDYDRAARQQQEEREEVAKERQEAEKARLEQIELQRQARQQQLERERQERLRIQEQKPVTQERVVPQQPTKPASPPPQAPNLDRTQPVPANSLDDEQLRKFRERIEQHQQGQ
jgi:periplasmic protein TonB